MWKYFNMQEFKCRCCGKVEIDPKLVDMLDMAREIAGVPFFITSGYRCPKHNAEVGGSPTSSHLKGKAADIRVHNNWDRYKILEGLIKAGFKRIGIAEKFIHADIDETKPQYVVWLYDKKREVIKL